MAGPESAQRGELPAGAVPAEPDHPAAVRPEGWWIPEGRDLQLIPSSQHQPGCTASTSITVHSGDAYLRHLETGTVPGLQGVARRMKSVWTPCCWSSPDPPDPVWTPPPVIVL